jgi:hypothetical protein
MSYDVLHKGFRICLEWNVEDSWIGVGAYIDFECFANECSEHWL